MTHIQQKIETATKYIIAFAQAGGIVLTFVLFAHFFPAPEVKALKFEPKIGGFDIELPVPSPSKPISKIETPLDDKGELSDGTKYWTLSGHDTAYKNDILKDFQNMLTKEGIPQNEQRWYVAQIYQENGALASHVIGDSGCSFGILQYNACARKGMNAKRFLEKHPEWKDTNYQLKAMVAEIVYRREKYKGHIRRTVLGHNCPACASGGGLDSKAGYVAQIERKLPLFTLASL